MAITAKFVSDFTDFNKGVQSAETNLASLYGSVQKLAGVFGVAVGAGAIVAFGKSLVDTAGHLVDMSQKTGNSIEQLQRWTAVGQEAGVTIDDLSAGAYKLGIALTDGDKGVIKAVEQLGLNFQKLRTMNPDEQFNTVIAALERMTDVQERNRVGQELFGKAWATVAAGYSDIAKAARISSDEQIRAIDAASDAWDKFVSDQKTKLTSWLGDRVIASNEFSKLTKEEAVALAELGMAGGDVQAKLLEMARARAKQVDINLPAQKETVQLTKDERIAADKLAEAMVELNAAGSGWLGTLQTIDGEIVEAVKFYLDAGVAQGTLATAYGLTAVQVKAIGAAMAETEALEKAEADANVRRVEERQKLTEIMFARELDLYKTLRGELEATTAARLKEVNEGILKELAAQIELNKAMGLDAAGAVAIAETALSTYATKMAELNVIKASGEDITKRAALAEHELAEGLLAEARATDQVVDAAKQIPPAAKPAKDSVLQLGAAASQAADNFFSMSGELYNAIRAAQQWDDLAQKDRNIYGSTIGGIGGSSASTRWGQANTMITINGSVLGNKDEIARVVGDAVTSSYRTGGNRLPV
jgi:hypothetical protein